MKRSIVALWSRQPIPMFNSRPLHVDILPSLWERNDSKKYQSFACYSNAMQTPC